jgi:hypothetical protein
MNGRIRRGAAEILTVGALLLGGALRWGVRRGRHRAPARARPDRLLRPGGWPSGRRRRS